MIYLILLAELLFFYRRTVHYLSYFQQEEYDNIRFSRWVFDKRAFDRRGSLIFILLFILGPSYIMLGLLFLLAAFFETNPLKQGKMLLKLTARAKRILFISFFFEFVLVLSMQFIAIGSYSWMLQLLVCQMLFLFLPLANIILKPYEKAVQNRYLRGAVKRYQSCNPYTIGITGSYGKTSVKNMLGEVLQVTKGATFWPAKGVNTLMGIVAQIRFGLSSLHGYAVIEMGAYQRGSIEKLCSLTPPQAAIITAVGLCHLERFGSQKNILKAKSELAQALPEDGILVYNGDDEGASAIARKYPKETMASFGFHARCDCYISAYKYDIERGNSFCLVWKGREYKGTTKLYGKTAFLNIMAVFTMAVILGAEAEYVLGAISNLEGVANRLQLQKAAEVYYLQDGYNSNPAGFNAALDLLKELPFERRILMTPGMVELGDRQNEEHYKIASKAAGICDEIIIVGDLNKEALTKGLQDAGYDRIKYFDHRDGALEYIKRNSRSGDLILIENDLTDIYERKVRL